MAEHTFTAELWLWDARRPDTWTFVTVPAEVSEEIEAASGPRAGFGSVRVSVRIGATRWQTSVFPDKASRCYVLPVKQSVRRMLGVAEGDEVTVHIEVG